MYDNAFYSKFLKQISELMTEWLTIVLKSNWNLIDAQFSLIDNTTSISVLQLTSSIEVIVASVKKSTLKN